MSFSDDGNGKPSPIATFIKKPFGNFGGKAKLSVSDSEGYDPTLASQKFSESTSFVKKDSDAGGDGHKTFPFESLSKKERFEQFLTYRKRLTRLAFSQCCYLYEIQFLTSDNNFQDEITSEHLDKKINPDDIVKSVVFLYRNVFFYGRYGLINKKKKLEEKKLCDDVTGIIKYINEIDDIIKHKLKPKWTVYRLDPIVRSILRAAVYELTRCFDSNKKIIISEYVKLSTSYYDDPVIIGFINGILDKISQDYR